MEKKVSKAFVEKQETVGEIGKLVGGAKSIIFMDYRGVTVEEITKLREKFRESGVVYKIYKNTLVKKALNNAGITALDDKLVGTLAVAFSNKDEVSAAKIILDAKFDKKMAFQFGLVGAEVLDGAGVEQLSKMPNKETLVAQLLSLLNTGARGLASVINAVPRNLAVVLDARTKQIA